MLIIETPWTSHQIAVFARSNGAYTRPVMGHLVDLRVEDIIPPKVRLLKEIHLLARLPNIPEIGQTGMFLSATGNHVDRIDISEAEAQELYQAGNYLLLPSNSESPLWKHTQSPWWEYSFVLDEHDGYIKAPKNPRPNEPTADEIDEKLDEYPENHGKLKALSPQTIERLKKKHNSEYFKARMEAL